MGSTDRVGGDEVISYTTVLPFIHGLSQGKLIPTFLAYYHEPIQQLIQLPVVLLGASVFYVRLPNIIFGILTYFLLFKISQKLFRKNSWYSLCVLAFYTFSGFTGILRMGIDAALFNFVLAWSILYFIDYYQNKNLDSFKKFIVLSLLNLFIFIDGVFIFGFTFFGKFKKISEKIILVRRIWKPVVLAMILMLSWGAMVYAGSVWSNMYDWRIQAPFKLFTRGSSFSLTAISDTYRLFNMFNSLEFTVTIFCLLAFSVLEKRARIVWGLLAVPLIYFNLVKMPTLHIINFWVLIVLASTLGVRFLNEKICWAKYILIPLIVLALFRNIQNIQFENPFDNDKVYKIAATFLRKTTPLCDKVYLESDLDGSAFRFYFDRGYVTQMNEQIKIGFVDGDSAYLEALGFRKNAQVSRPGKINLSIYQRGYNGKVADLYTVDDSLFNFSNTLDYVSKCYF